MIVVSGRYEVDNGLIRLFTDGTMYEIVSPSNWRCINVGQMSATNFIFTQEIYDKWAAKCTREGVFELEE